MPPASDSNPQSSTAPSMVPASRAPSSRSSFHQEGVWIDLEPLEELQAVTSPPPANESNPSSGSARRQTTENGPLRLDPSQPFLGAQQSGTARPSTTILDEDLLFDSSSHISNPPSLSPDLIQEEYAGEAEMNRQRRKRRRLTAGVSAYQHPPYGHKGQVVPGPLKMEVVDVNTHESSTRSDPAYQANILRRDWKIYATETDHCDIMLAHKGRVPFSVAKIVIRVPLATTYRAPIGEGLVFVAMKPTDFARTCHYRLRDADPIPGRGVYVQFHDRPPSRRADNFITLTNPTRHIAVAPPTNPAANNWQPLGSHWVRPPTTTRARSSAEPSSPRRVLSPPILDSEFNVRATNGDSSSESEELSGGDESQATTTSGHATPDRRSRARTDTPRPSFSPTPPPEESDDDNYDEMEAAVRRRMNWGPPVPASPGHAWGSTMNAPVDQGVTDLGAYVSSTPRRRRLRSYKKRDSNGSAGARSEREREGQTLDVLRPHARFFFDKGKTRVSIKFDPPVSGKHILLKLWSKSEDQTIDIQNITAYGYVGQRFFPSVQVQ